MATRLDLYKHAVDFAFNTIGVVGNRELTSKAMEAFGSQGFPDNAWDDWIADVQRLRGVMLNMKDKFLSKPAPKPAPAPQTATPEVKG